MEAQKNGTVDIEKGLVNFMPTITSYAPILTGYQIPFVEEGSWLRSGSFEGPTEYVFFLPARLLEVKNLLHVVLPILRELEGIAFQIAKNDIEAAKITNGYYGHELDGKMIQIKTASTDQALQLATKLKDATKYFKGMCMVDAIRLASVLYVVHVQIPVFANAVKMLRHPLYQVFKPSRKLNKLPRKKFIGKWYLPVKELRSSIKGGVYKGINLRKMEWCLIKQGNAFAIEDLYGRDSRERIRWQAQVLDKLKGLHAVSKVLATAEYKDFNFLILEYIEGESLENIVKGRFRDRNWKDFNNKEKAQLFSWFLEVLDILKYMHEADVIHRDVTPANFLVINETQVSVIDLELSFSLGDMEPYPPFVMGTDGYVSPEQLHYRLPMPSDDVYSLGGLFLFLVTGKQPKSFGSMNQPDDIKEILEALDLDPALCALISMCFGPAPLRPTVTELINTTQNNIDHLLILNAL